MPRQGDQRLALTIDILREYLHYDPATGVWTRLKRSGHRCVVGDRADRRERRRENLIYRRVKLLKASYPAHQLAWFYMTGEWPRFILDHKDRDGENNAWNNLRPATPSQNSANSRRSKQNTSGWKGVHWSKTRKKWCVQSKRSAKRNLGGFDCPAAAHFAYLVASDKLYGEFACAG